MVCGLSCSELDALTASATTGTIRRGWIAPYGNMHNNEFATLERWVGTDHSCNGPGGRYLDGTSKAKLEASAYSNGSSAKPQDPSTYDSSGDIFT